MNFLAGQVTQAADGVPIHAAEPSDLVDAAALSRQAIGPPKATNGSRIHDAEHFDHVTTALRGLLAQTRTWTSGPLSRALAARSLKSRQSGLRQ